MPPSSIDTTVSGDIHHSAPPSPSTAMSSPTHSAPPPEYQTTSLDDVFGSSPTYTTGFPADSSHGASFSVAEPSDLPSLRRQHVTAGYRDGVSAAKHEHVQRGFDAGFPVGGRLGMRVGVVLGVLEGLINCSNRETAITNGDGGSSTDIRSLYDLARAELDVQKVFGSLINTDDESEQRQDPCVALEKAGEETVSKWEETVMKLIPNQS
ncbi:predicted protein [Uncinocarpus reesii 1704]|uniref:Protein YAE1 n=1 Tax=Uncinocarpus reesii (strain UAMH 1704) TaxID=336963 RepID=C4JXU3_UNCRE|nr:uncharacterized protein UREG_07881 [Uncinocarpus reesii 1704]EEP83016.1 predicted protein [Uncinocarpus reesii 1704]